MKLFRLAIVAALAFSIAFVSCKKKKDEDPDTTSLQQVTKDEAEVENASNEAMNDADDLFANSNTKSVCGRNIPANATMDTVVVGDSTIYTLTFNGLNAAGNRNRTGQIQIRKLTTAHWSDMGATLLVKLINYKVTRVSTNKSVKFNGTKTFVNVSGGQLRQLGVSITTPIIHTINSTNMLASFDDGSSRNWNIARKRTFSLVSGQVQLQTEGTGSSNGYDKLVVWGTNRNGEAFYTQINTPIVHKKACNWDPCSGVKVHSIPGDGKKATATFGYDANNNPITNGDCPSKFKVDWEKNGRTGTVYIPL